MLASQTEEGNKNSPFSNKSPLEFKHLLTKVTFYAKRDKKMQSSKLVHDVKVTLSKSYLINKWEYNKETYVAAGAQETIENDLTSVSYTHLLIARKFSPSSFHYPLLSD